MKPTRLAPLLLLSVSTQAAPVDFERDIRPLLREHCIECHGPDKQKSGYRLDRRADAFTGGESGNAAIVANEPEKSPLVRFVSGADAEMFMPPKKSNLKPLNAEQVSVLKRWISEGAHWPGAEERAAAVVPQKEQTHWSLLPIQKQAPPPDAPHPVDAFVRARLRETGIGRAPQADKRTLLRRLSFDLTGLPPSREQMQQFLEDTSASAYEHAVDRLLGSPQYGERWARHWLDVVHFGETHGYDKDKPRPNAWPYRDYVIRAFNEDKPFARFIQEQIAGDALFPGTRDGTVALGFIAAGPWDYIGHAEVPETKTDGKIARHLDRDDMVSNTINTFCSLTVHCAQCHDHKFDPIAQEDYYALQAVFAGVDRTDRKYFADAELTTRFNALEREQKGWSAKQKELEDKLRSLAAKDLEPVDKGIADLEKAAGGTHPPEHGYHSGTSADQNAPKWVQVDLGESVALDRIVLKACYDDFAGIGAGFGFPVRFRIETCEEPAFKTEPVLVADFTRQDVKNPGLEPRTYPTNGAKGRYVRVTATKLAPRKDTFIFALAELEAIDAGAQNRARGKAVSALDSIEAAPRWRKSNLVDAVAPGTDRAGELAALKKKREALLQSKATPEMKEELAQARAKLSETKASLEKFPKPEVVYAAGIHYGTGAFRGTGPDGGKPRPIYLLGRGDVKRPGKPVNPGAIRAVSMLPGRFELDPGADESERRAALAQWIASKSNPLTWRSIVNRVWQYHFGKGLVETSNDFGKMGSAPSHPALLDWLAAQFRDEMDGSLKQLHRLVVTSETYKQSSGFTDAKGIESDSENRLLWRQNRRRLEAEAVRDSILCMSGKLDLTMGGPSFQDFVVTHPEHSPHYEFHLADPEDAKTHRRSVYRFLVRSQQQPWMATMDCADPSMLVDRRNQTITPLQALAQLNNPLMTAMAEHFAKRVAELEAEPGKQAVAAFQLALQRAPTPTEHEALTAYTRANGLANACRLMLNLNEFVFVD